MDRNIISVFSFMRKKKIEKFRMIYYYDLDCDLHLDLKVFDLTTFSEWFYSDCIYEIYL